MDSGFRQNNEKWPEDCREPRFYERLETSKLTLNFDESAVI